jgi:hypothetical protein
MLRQDRFVAYLTVEAFALLQYAVNHREGERQQAAYRGLARTVSRAYYGPVRPDGDFEYYERMEHFVESGVYDETPGATQLHPEDDPTTYNGSVWLFARQTFWDDPNVSPDTASAAYKNALAFYTRRAVRPQFQWSWRNAQLEQDLFRRTIRASNDAFRKSVQDLGLVIANHVLSTVDAYISVRVRSGGPDRYDVEVTLPLPSGRSRGDRDKLERQP